MIPGIPRYLQPAIQGRPDVADGYITALTGRTIAAELGMLQGRVVTGRDLAAMPDEQLTGDGVNDPPALRRAGRPLRETKSLTFVTLVLSSVLQGRQLPLGSSLGHAGAVPVSLADRRDQLGAGGAGGHRPGPRCSTQAFGTFSLSWPDWLPVTGLSAIVVGVLEAVKALQRRFPAIAAGKSP